MKTRYYIERLSEPLRKSGYFDLFKGIIASREMEEVLEFLESQKDSGERFSPALKTVFRPFVKTPLDQLKVVFLNTYPEHRLGLSNGLAFGLVQTGDTTFRTAVYRLFEEISENLNVEPSLEYLADQGVLLLNQSMTVPLSDRLRRKHLKAWNFLITYFLDMMNHHHPEVPIVLFGKEPSKLNDLLTNNQGFPIPEPNVENAKNVLTACNTFLVSVNKSPVLF